MRDEQRGALWSVVRCGDGGKRCGDGARCGGEGRGIWLDAWHDGALWSLLWWSLLWCAHEKTP